jgi:AcrR family transcriptional regulator
MGRPARSTADTGERPTTRERVAHAAIDLFARRGYHGTGIRDIAAAAGLTTATLYHYMSNKDDLLVEIMRGTIEPLRQAAASILAELTDPAAALAAIVENHVWVHASERLATLVADTELRALSGERRSQIVALRDEYESAWRTVVHRGLDHGVFHTGYPEVAARSLLQMATGVSHWFARGGELTLEQLCRSYADWGLALLRAGRSPQAPIRRADLELPAPPHYLPA